MAKPKSIGGKAKKKIFVPILASKLFNNQVIGETPVVDPQVLVGRKIKANFMTLSNDFKKQHVSLKFQITNIDEGKANSVLAGYEVTFSFIKRLVRRGRTKVPDSFTFTTKDGVIVRIKPVIVTQSRVPQSTASELRMTFRDEISSLGEKENFSQLISQFLDGKLQKHFKNSLSKIAPLRTFELKSFVAVNEAKESEVVRDAPKKKIVKKIEEKPVAKEEPKAEVKPEVKEETKPEVKEEVKEEPKVEESKAE